LLHQLTAIAAIALILPHPAAAQGVPECWRFEGTTFPVRIYRRDTQRMELYELKGLRLMPERARQFSDSTALRVIPTGVDSIGLLALSPSFWKRVTPSKWTVYWKEADEDRVLELQYNGATLQGRYTAVGSNEGLATAMVRGFPVSCGGG
jgi:hypothetical protein